MVTIHNELISGAIGVCTGWSIGLGFWYASLIKRKRKANPEEPKLPTTLALKDNPPELEIPTTLALAELRSQLRQIDHIATKCIAKTETRYDQYGQPYQTNIVYDPTQIGKNDVYSRIVRLEQAMLLPQKMTVSDMLEPDPAVALPGEVPAKTALAASSAAPEDGNDAQSPSSSAEEEGESPSK